MGICVKFGAMMKKYHDRGANCRLGSDAVIFIRYFE
jgi:hypothetical protein